jgi:hypothetical protein
MRDYEAKEFSGWHAKDTLQRIQHHLVPLKIFKGFREIANQVGSFPGHDRDVVDVSVHVPTNLVLQALMHRTLVSGTCIFQTKRHGDIAVSAQGCDEQGRLFKKINYCMGSAHSLLFPS